MVDLEYLILGGWALGTFRDFHLGAERVQRQALASRPANKLGLLPQCDRYLCCSWVCMHREVK